MIGTIISWYKTPLTPALDNKWVECNGQTLSDASSPYDGQVIPNLNGSGGATRRFLRGSTTSGGTGGAETNTHSHTITTTAQQDTGNDTTRKPIVTSVSNETINILPAYFEVVYIMKVK
jgi:hypothetical protein